ncbi:MAG TPA: hypothetical protein VFD27_12110, partial [Chthoniobacteraceae bacterium]|nr:hypothetical protein [Chthoniobacteraceae bacterium]
MFPETGTNTRRLVLVEFRPMEIRSPLEEERRHQDNSNDGNEDIDLVRRHKGLDNHTPAQAAGIESKRWTLVDVVEMSDR